jgi:hypothetical protein
MGMHVKGRECSYGKIGSRRDSEPVLLYIYIYIYIYIYTKQLTLGGKIGIPQELHNPFQGGTPIT